MDKIALLKGLRPEHLEGAHKEVYNALSVKLPPDQVLYVVFQLGELYGGERLYFPKLDSLLREARKNLIRKEFNGSNHRMLVRKFNLSDQEIRRILKQKRNAIETNNLH